MAETAEVSKGRFWMGWVLTALAGMFIISGSFTAWSASPQVVAGTGKLGYGPEFLRVLAPIEFVCGVLYLVPRTAVFGALLLTAYLGGAVASHLRVSDPQWPAPIVFGIVLWAGLMLRRRDVQKVIF